jgi:hypothetical protein
VAGTASCLRLAADPSSLFCRHIFPLLLCAVVSSDSNHAHCLLYCVMSTVGIKLY